MEQESRLDKAIKGLSKILERNKDFKDITIAKQTIHMGNTKTAFWGTIAYLAILLIIPTGLLTYEFIQNKDDYFLLIILPLYLFLFIRNLNKIVRSQNVARLDLGTKKIEVKNINGIFGKYIKDQTLDFQEISKIQLVSKSASRLNSWLELTLSKENGKQIVVSSFNDRYPDSFIAQKLRFLFEVIIWTEKRQKQQ